MKLKVFLTSENGHEQEFSVSTGVTVSSSKEQLSEGIIEVSAVYGAIQATSDAIKHLSPMKYEELRGRSCTWRLYGVKDFAITISAED